VKELFSRYIVKFCSIAAVTGICLCSVPQKKFESHIFALDTVIDVTLYTQSSHAAQHDLDSLETMIMHLDTLLSISAPAGDIYRINHRRDSIVVLNRPVRDIMQICRREWQQSGGLFDITVAPLKYLYGLEAHQESHHVPAQSELDSCLRIIGFNKIRFVNDSTLVLPQGLTLDFGGIGKGYIMQQIQQFLRGKGYTSFLINIGGDILINGSRPNGSAWNIGIRDPRNDQELSAQVRVKNTDVFTSGDYERYFMGNGIRYHHLFNPQTGQPSRCNRSVTVIGNNPLVVDAVVKAAFIMQAPGALSYLASRNMQGCVIDSIGGVWISIGLKQQITVDSGVAVQYR
jgi:thiamine biosynthesis lipoprotein